MSYSSAWKAAHPAYRERERVRLLTRRRGDRTAERARAKVVAAGRTRVGIPDVSLDHPLIARVAALLRAAKRPGTLLAFSDELNRQDAISIGVLAVLEDRDPLAAMTRFFSSELDRRLRWAEMPVDA